MAQSVENAARPSACELAALAVILVLAGALRFHELGRPPLWLDEQVHYTQANRPTLREVLNASNFQGPTGRLGWLDSAVALWLGAQTRGTYRIPQVLEGIAAIAALWWLARRWINPRAGLFAAALLAASSLHIMYSRDARPYSMLVLVSVLLALSFDLLVRKQTALRFAALAGLTAFALGIHPLAAILCLGLGAGAVLAMLVNARPETDVRWGRAAGYSAGAMVLGALPYIFLSYKMLNRGYLQSEIVNPPLNNFTLLQDIVDIYKGLVGGFWGAGAYLAALLALLGAYAGFVQRERRWAGALAIFAAAAGVIPITISHGLNHFVVPRYSIFAMPFLYVLAGCGADWVLSKAGSLPEPRLSLRQAFIAPVLALLLLVSMRVQDRSPYDLERFKWQSAEPGRPTLPE